MTSNIIKKLALTASSAFPVAATVATATVLGWSNPAQSASFNFSFNGSSEYTVLGSFSYDHTLYSGTIGKNQLDSFNISFIQDGKIKQENSTLSSLFDFEFDTASKFIKSIDAGAFSMYDWQNSAPDGSLSFENKSDLLNDVYKGCGGLVWQKDSHIQASTGGYCAPDSKVVVTPSEPGTQPVPEPASTMSLLVVGAFGTVFRLKRTNKVA
ncbi:hypothetical protein H6F77_11075 [Microcoleus sp. FACHB-831]|uniref:hypothetical protein n=1 Tax=Microcoleus sp. FACHB-831 TaxID=2692827 RepID=UPI001687A6ED|nr:hypothetical protein [Microcoleus sp. FACHB-831]MBD1921634.1 hypothetical protein [Microcoleus sp. FACHB-831]